MVIRAGVKLGISRFKVRGLIKPLFHASCFSSAYFVFKAFLVGLCVFKCGICLFGSFGQVVFRYSFKLKYAQYSIKWFLEARCTIKNGMKYHKTIIFWSYCNNNCWEHFYLMSLISIAEVEGEKVKMCKHGLTMYYEADKKCWVAGWTDWKWARRRGRKDH